MQVISVHKKRKDSMETRAKLAVLCTFGKTKLYKNPFFFIVYQNVEKPWSRAAKTVYETIFLPFYVVIISFFLFTIKMQIYCNRIKVCCAITGCNYPKKHKLALYQTQSGEPNYINHKIPL